MEALRDGDPRRVGSYALLGRLGQGGMGLVYLARDEAGAQVAVKVLHRHLTEDPDFRRLFRREVAAAQRVARFCTAPVLAADADGDPAYLVTEFVPGPSLERAVQTGGPLTGSSLDGLAVSIAVALRAIHGAGIVHRDLKPSNVLLSPVGPRVIDFGVARLADNRSQVSSVLVGTPGYMSPEQVKGEPITAASDVFAWGGVMVFAATGHGPFGTGAVPALLYRVAHDEPDLTGIRGPLLPLVAAALAKNPADRPTPQNLLDALSAGSEALPVGPGGLGAGPAVPPPGPVNPGTTGPGAPAAAGGHVTLPNAAAAGQEARTGGTAGAGRDREPTLGRALTTFGRRRPWVSAGAVTGAVAATVAVVIALQSGSAGDAAPSVSSPVPSGTAAQASEPVAAPPSPSASTPPLSASGPNPLDEGGVRLFAQPDGDAARQAKLWAAAGRAKDAELMTALAETPQAIWLKGPADKARRTVSATVKLAAKENSVPVFVTYNMPFKDCRPPGPAGGATDPASYRSWIDQVAEGIGDARAVVILEPQSLVNVPGTAECDLGGPTGAEDRFGNLSYAVGKLGALPRTAVYLDGSFEKWPSLEEMAHRLVRAGVTEADGFFLNASGYQPTAGLVDYGGRLARCVHVQVTEGTEDCLDAEIAAAPDDPSALPHFVIDTSRNGQGEWVPDKEYAKPQTWCNPPGRGVGLRPTTSTDSELVDAYLWISMPGHSNGTCTRGTDGPEDPVYGTEPPGGGEWWPELALGRAELASPPLR
ncbi:glycoside hydrolase family 6 protein [Planobispora longispora]|nr:glycoside hydrolase family 6 protein [Planobispora longispora]